MFIANIIFLIDII